MLYIGSHVSMQAPDYLLQSVKDALSYKANTFMFYTGAPQNTKRKPVSELKVKEAQALMKEFNLDFSKIIVHAPYIINLANTTKKETFEIAVSFLNEEIKRVEEIGAKYLVLHPGSHVKAGEEVGLKQIVNGLNQIKNDNVFICLETMSGKGSELGRTFEEIKYIIDHVEDNSMLRVCFDTCHVHDAGYDIINNLDGVIAEFDRIIGLDRLAVIHVNDSKNERGASKDRHENLGYGKIGFDTIAKVIHHPCFEGIVKILETPWYEGKPYYKKEIEMLRSQKYEEGFLDNEL